VLLEGQARREGEKRQGEEGEGQREEEGRARHGHHCPLRLPKHGVLETGHSRDGPFSERTILGTRHSRNGPFSDPAILGTGHSQNGPISRNGPRGQRHPSKRLVWGMDERENLRGSCSLAPGPCAGSCRHPGQRRSGESSRPSQGIPRGSPLQPLLLLSTVSS